MSETCKRDTSNSFPSQWLLCIYCTGYWMHLPRKYETDNTGWIEKVTLPYLTKIMAITAVAGAGNLSNSFLSDKLTPGLYFLFVTPIK